MDINERLDAANAAGHSLARIARIAEVPAMRLYNATMAPEERLRVESVLDKIARGDIAPRRPSRYSAVPA